ncbi:uncharacterized protein EI97DRAFT_458223 [Westerdykella ornata]|uniref:Uncharacterized protein n=1 Tax=Westerdykella ornata TaxID=318751 RepID=A0A6A6JJS5_WESOR|nr:uncharacterized protein EI97DRAFT_458223 [Westerdykella ornata]KAF2276900.1 hypothetical protein EI97DRAFT_458223 [Westerdykella ornata]
MPPLVLPIRRKRAASPLFTKPEPSIQQQRRRRKRNQETIDFDKLELVEPARPADHQHNLPDTDDSLLDDDADLFVAPTKDEIHERQAHLAARRAAKAQKMARREAALAAAAAERTRRSQKILKDTLPSVRQRVRNKKLQSVLSGSGNRPRIGNANVALMATRRTPGNRAGRLMRNDLVGIMNSVENGAEMEPTEEEREREEARIEVRGQEEERDFLSKVLREAE